jgi:hypothetical protein
MWWVAGATVNTGRIYSVIISCLDTGTSLVPLFLEQRVWQPVLITHDRLVPDIQTHFHIGKGTLMRNVVTFLSCACHTSSRHEIQKKKIDWWWKFSTQKSKVAAMYCDVHRHIHSWPHFKHYHVGKSNMVPMQPVRRFVCWSIVISIRLQKTWKIIGVILWTVWEIAHTFQFQINFLTKIMTGKMAQGCAEVVHTFGKL